MSTFWYYRLPVDFFPVLPHKSSITSCHTPSVQYPISILNEYVSFPRHRFFSATTRRPKQEPESNAPRDDGSTQAGGRKRWSSGLRNLSGSAPAYVLLRPKPHRPLLSHLPAPNLLRGSPCDRTPHTHTHTALTHLVSKSTNPLPPFSPNRNHHDGRRTTNAQ